ncbi:unnamed protein product [Arabidopsis lyrata]|nr:unnamed protein product [Arabidopsis lyrata]
MGRVYNKADSTTIKGCSSNSRSRYSSVAVNCEIAGTRGLRMHWKGKASVILDKCTMILENDAYRKMTTSKKSQLKEAINRMEAQNLICIALAFKNSIFGIEDPCLPAEGDEIRAPIDFHGNRNEEGLRDSVWDDGEICIAPESDSEVSDVPEDIKPHQWLGLYCYNFQKGTDYEFKRCAIMVEGSKEADHEWDNEAIDDRYKGEMPKWLSDDDLQHCYVVKDSELMETKNWWLLLFSEFAFYTKWSGTLRPRDAVECLPLETQKVVVETQGKAETEPRELRSSRRQMQSST